MDERKRLDGEMDLWSQMECRRCKTVVKTSTTRNGLCEECRLRHALSAEELRQQM